MPDNFHRWLASRPGDKGDKVVISEFFSLFNQKKDLSASDPQVRREIDKAASMLGLPYWASDPHLRYAFLHVVNVMHPRIGVGGMIVFPTMQIIADAVREEHPDPDDPDDPDSADLRSPAVRHGGTPVKLYFFLHSIWGGVHKDAKPQAGFKDMNNANYPDDPWPPRRRPRKGGAEEADDGASAGGGGGGGHGGGGGGAPMSVADIIKAWPDKLSLGRMDDGALAALALQLGENLRKAGIPVTDSTPERLADAAGKGPAPSSSSPASATPRYGPLPHRPSPSPAPSSGTGPIVGHGPLPRRSGP
jgi:hypothetical protein